MPVVDEIRAKMEMRLEGERSQSVKDDIMGNLDLLLENGVITDPEQDKMMLLRIEDDEATLTSIEFEEGALSFALMEGIPECEIAETFECLEYDTASDPYAVACTIVSESYRAY